MRKNLLLVLGLIVALVVALNAQEKKAEKKMEKPMEKEMTIKGEVVDISCYLHMGATGDDHKACAEACAKNGGSLGILTADNKLYVSIVKDEHKENPNKLLMDHIAHTVEVKGYVHSKGGVQGIRVTDVSMSK